MSMKYVDVTFSQDGQGHEFSQNEFYASLLKSCGVKKKCKRTVAENRSASVLRDVQKKTPLSSLAPQFEDSDDDIAQEDDFHDEDTLKDNFDGGLANIETVLYHS
ncbi:hypothetical protein QAD02_021585 [Eretmocerus hayati]|uniref:Uncharacterized protein n=1 Tax=Eretmocerus hayati TaxID=131215 RepID=A0ACC2PQU9_9HYME|nr:hypothetical protein QAD02_021585 [Eretmocerus hayati]